MKKKTKPKKKTQDQIRIEKAQKLIKKHIKVYESFMRSTEREIEETFDDDKIEYLESERWIFDKMIMRLSEIYATLN